MAQSMVNFRMDTELKEKMEIACKNMGLTLTAAFTMFAARLVKEQRIPFDVCVDPFFSADNIRVIKKRIEEVESGISTLKEHDLIED